MSVGWGYPNFKKLAFSNILTKGCKSYSHICNLPRKSVLLRRSARSAFLAAFYLFSTWMHFTKLFQMSLSCEHKADSSLDNPNLYRDYTVNITSCCKWLASASTWTKLGGERRVDSIIPPLRMALGSYSWPAHVLPESKTLCWGYLYHTNSVDYLVASMKHNCKTVMDVASPQPLALTLHS